MKRANSDHALAIVKAGISCVPVVGGAIASLVSDYVPTATQRSIERATDILRERIENLGDRIDVENVKKDEFSELFKSCYLLIVRTHKEEKLRAASSLLVTLLLKEGDRAKLSYRELNALHLVHLLGAPTVRTPDYGNYPIEFTELGARFVVHILEGAED